MSLRLARFVAGRFDNWSDEQNDMMESSREMCRNIINYIGWNQETQPLMDFWIAMTQVTVMLHFDEERASTIGPEGIGGYPIPAKPLATLREVNPFMLQCMKRDIVTLQETLELLEASMDLFSYGSQDDEDALKLLADTKGLVVAFRSILGVPASCE